MLRFALHNVYKKTRRFLQGVANSDRESKDFLFQITQDEFEGLRETSAIKAYGDLLTEIKKGISALKKKPKVYTLEELFE